MLCDAACKKVVSRTGIIGFCLDNEKSASIGKELYTENIVFSPRGALNSNFFLYWMKNVFIPGIPEHKRPAALLVDAQLEILDYEILKFASDNGIVLYRSVAFI